MHVPVTEGSSNDDEVDYRVSAPIVRIQSLTRRGHALGALPDGTDLLADGPLPGDTLRVEAFRKHGTKLYATSWQLLEGAEGRRRPPCHVAATCGGCALMALSEQAQREAKLNQVLGALQRAHVAPPPTRFVHDGRTFHYRNRIRLAVDESGKLGFFNPNKANDCLVLSDPLHAALADVRDRLAGRPEWMKNVAHVEVRAPDLDGKVGVFFTPRDPVLARPLLETPPDLGAHVLTGVYGQSPIKVPRQRVPLMEHLWFYVPLNSFMQVNTLANADLVMYVTAGALKRSARSFVDLYAGAGNFTLPLLAVGLDGAAVEQNIASVLSIADSAAKQQLDPPDTVATDAIATAKHWGNRGELFDLVVIDPPRAGLKHGAESVASIARKHIAMCSCSPESMARDVRAFLDLGFEIEEMLLFDMFPQTHHVETLVWLARHR